MVKTAFRSIFYLDYVFVLYMIECYFLNFLLGLQMACKDQNQKWCPEFQVWRDKAPIEVTCVCIWDDSWSCGSRDCGVVDFIPFRFSSVQFGRSVVSDSATPWITACQASLSITNSWSSLRLMSIESVMPSSHLILCCPLLTLPPIPPSISLFQWVNSSHEVAKVLEFQL